MRKQLIPLIVTLLSLIGNNTFAQTFSGGSGTLDDPWQISTKADLNTIATYVNNNSNNFSGKYFKLTADLSGINTFIPIGNSAAKSFQGHFDGGGNTLSSVNISSRTYVGLFGYISGATIKNVKIGSGSNIYLENNGNTGALIGYAVNSTIDNCNTIVTPNSKSECRLGGLIGYAEGCTISNCSNTATSTVNSSNTNSYYGGLVGYANNTTFNSCYSTAGMSGDTGSKIGGLIGFDTICIINECYSTATFSNLNGYIGGLIGHSIGSQINKSYSTANIQSSSGSNNRIGGLVGFADSTTINNCYSRASFSTSTMNGSGYTGGLIGYIDNGSTISNSYSVPSGLGTITNSGNLYGFCYSNPNCFTNSYYLSGGNTQTYGIPKSSIDMQTMQFAIDLNACQIQTWKRLDNDYPILYWQSGGASLPRCLDGSGTETDPFRIRCVADLVTLSNNVAGGTTYLNQFLLVENDISFINGGIDSSQYFNPIGDSINSFRGNFNGGGHAIANYSFSDTTKNNIGFFGYTNLATIQRLGISNINICAKDTVGGLVANAESTKIGGCFVYGYIKGKNSVGGLVGVGTGATSAIDTSFTNTSIDAQTNVGGLVGNHSGGTINNSYSNSEIYSSTTANNYVGGIIGRASSSNLTNVYSTCKIIRNGSNTNFGKIKGNTQGTTGAQCYSRDNVFVNCDNITPSGYNGTSMNNAGLRNPTFATSTLGSANWKADYSPDRINDGYPILKYQPAAVKPNSSGLWPTTTASQVVIIKSGVQLKADTANFPKCAYVKIEAGGELNNTTNINLFGEYNRELYVGKWNLIGLSTYNQTLASLYNYADTSFKTFVKEFDYITNNWSTTTTQGVNTKFEIGEGILVMPNYSLDDRLIIKSRIVSKGVLYNDTTYQVPNPTTSAGRFVSLANNYPASLTVTQNDPPISGNTAGLIQGNLVYIYDADSGKWNNNFNTNVRVTSIKPGEGFFIAASSTGGNFLFEKSQIRNTSGAKNLIKSDLIYVQAIVDNNIRESFLEFNEETDNAFDFNDGLMLFGNNYNSVEPYFTISTPEINDSTTQLIKDAFSSLPYTTELNLRSQKSNEVTLNFSNIPDDIHVYLIDSLLKTAQYLNQESDYNLIVGAGDNKDRLFIEFSHYKKDIRDFFKKEVNSWINIWNNDNTLYIEGKELLRFDIFDIMGNKVVQGKIDYDNYQVKLNLRQGIYIVKAYSKIGYTSKKISVQF